MHKLCFLAVAVLLLASVLPCVGASGEGYYSTVLPGGPRGSFGAIIGSANGYDSTDTPAAAIDYWTSGVFHAASEPGWGGPEGFYRYDLRAPLALGASHSWIVNVWAAPGADAMDRYLYFYWNSLDPFVTGTVELIQKPAGAAGGPPVGKVWHGEAEMVFPTVTNPDPDAGYKFKVTLTMVPEPASSVALASLLVGSAGLLKRRK